MAARLSPAALVTRGSLFTYLEPKLAMDSVGTIDYTSLVQGLTGRNFKARSQLVERAVRQATRGKLAMDNNMEDLASLLSALAPQAAEADQAPGLGQIASAPGGSAGPMTATPSPDQGGSTQDIVAKIKAYLEQEGVAPEILNNLDAFLAEHQPNNGPNGPGGPMGGQDRLIPAKQQGQDQESGETIEGEPGSSALRVMEPRGGDESDFTPESAEDEEPSPGTPRREDPWGEAEDDELIPSEQAEQMGGVAQVSSAGKSSRVVNGGGQDRMPITKAAMDRAIQLAQDRAIKNQRAIRDAERYVRIWVGDLAMDAAGPADIYRAALKALGVPGVDRVHPDALRPILDAQPKPSARTAQDHSRRIAQDAKVEGDFFSRFPDAKRIILQ
jgi:hypothetical protein